MTNDKKYKILIVEDEEMLRAIYQRKFEQENLDVVMAKDGLDAHKKIKEGKFDLVLLDIIMPKVDGFTVLTEIKNDPETKDLPVIMFTNLSTEEDEEKTRKLGALDYLVKSDLTPTQIVEKVKEYLK